MSGDDRVAPAACADFDEDLSALLDGELAGPRASEVRAHAAACARCAARLAELARVRSAVADLLRAPATGDEAARVDGARAALHARLASEAPPARVRPRAAPGRPRSGVTLRHVAAIAVAAAAALVLLRLARAPRPAPPPASVPQIAREAPPPAELPQPPPPERPVVAPTPPQDAASAERALASKPSSRVPPSLPPAPPAPAAQSEGALASADEEDLDVALHLDTLEDLEVIERLDLLEKLAARPRDGGARRGPRDGSG